ncbi:HD domain-containing protein [Intestinibacter sp.]
MNQIPGFFEDFSKTMNELHTKSRFPLTKDFIQHGDVSVYEHCIFVAYMSYIIANKLNLKVDKKSLIRGALLHDYFLYDWHDKNKPVKLHGFKHPKIALKNASEDFALNKKERDIILHHMFPLTIAPPNSKEAWIICLADKICATKETFGSQYDKQLNSIYRHLDSLYI